MVTLFEHPLSPHAQKVKIALAGKGVELTAQRPDFAAAFEQAQQSLGGFQMLPDLTALARDIGRQASAGLEAPSCTTSSRATASRCWPGPIT